MTVLENLNIDEKDFVSKLRSEDKEMYAQLSAKEKEFFIGYYIGDDDGYSDQFRKLSAEEKREVIDRDILDLALSHEYYEEIRKQEQEFYYELDILNDHFKNYYRVAKRHRELLEEPLDEDLKHEYWENKSFEDELRSLICYQYEFDC